MIAAHLGGSSVVTEVSRLRHEAFVIETERSRSDGRARVEGPIRVLYDELNLLRADLEAEHRKPTPVEIERVKSIYSQAFVLWEERQRATSGGVFRIPTPVVRSASGTQAISEVGPGQPRRRWFSRLRR
ncbi:hypothetical protein [Nocardia sp. NPDC056100]|uniref:hypothetical protein n=1 Tax=Nocardia sp. NPDC056100 TaxID=3345712 RepID=UPI0035DC68E9